MLKSEAEARFGPFPSLDEARQALAEQIERWGSDADTEGDGESEDVEPTA